MSGTTNESKQRRTFFCEVCDFPFDSERPQQEAEAEAERLWGVKNAASDPGMAVVCGKCFRAVQAWLHGKETP